ncbi:hypothetical protein BOPS111487_19795 [Bordetella pseudohinzii]
MARLLSALEKSTVAPGATLLALVPCAVTFHPLLATVETACNCPTLTASVVALPAAILLSLSPPPSMPAVVMLGPPVRVRPLAWSWVVPRVTASTFRLRDRAKRSLLSVAPLVMARLLSALAKSTVAPGATLLALAPCAVTFQPLLATEETACSCPTLTASVVAVPAAILLSLSPPPSIPAVVMLGPPVKVRPLACSWVVPSVTASTFRLRDRAKRSLLSVAPLVMARLLSGLEKSTVAPGATLLALAPCAVTFQPLLATVETACS